MHMHEKRNRVEIPAGTLQMLILKTLSWGPAHGYAIAQHIKQATDGVLQVEEGSLYPALHRMEQEGWLKGAWGTTEANRQARFYELTAAGRKQLAAEEEDHVAILETEKAQYLNR